MPLSRGIANPAGRGHIVIIITTAESETRVGSAGLYAADSAQVDSIQRVSGLLARRLLGSRGAR
jgi:hypothetical protein